MRKGEFPEFLKDRERISNAYIQGRPDELTAIATRHDPATFMPPSGEVVSGAEAVSRAHTSGAKIFRNGSTGHFEVLQSGSSGDLGYWTGIQHAEVVMEGKDMPIAMQLRTTEIFRREGGEWKLVHRHADMNLDDKR